MKSDHVSDGERGFSFLQPGDHFDPHIQQRTRCSIIVNNSHTEITVCVFWCVRAPSVHMEDTWSCFHTAKSLFQSAVFQSHPSQRWHVYLSSWESPCATRRWVWDRTWPTISFIGVCLVYWEHVWLLSVGLCLFIVFCICRHICICEGAESMYFLYLRDVKTVGLSLMFLCLFFSTLLGGAININIS